jgi:hypothetical protein
MKRLFLGFAVGLLLGSISQGQELENERNLTQPFVAGGNIRLVLSSGDYTVRAGNSDDIRVRWSAENLDHVSDMKRIKVDLRISDSTATIRTSGPTKHARIVVEVPPQSHLALNMRAGDVRIVGVEGNKDIHMTAGDLKIDVLPSSYALMHATVKVGDLEAEPLGISKSGFGRSLNWNGVGKYTLHATLFAGDLTLSRPAVH